MTKRAKVREWNKRIKRAAHARHGTKRTEEKRLHAFVHDLLRAEMKANS